jgi:predicted RNA binding protein YcfA (HicA-like mRNA interferase family)
MKRRTEILRLAETYGWTAEPTRKGHLRLRHQRATGTVIVSGTPGDRREIEHTRARLRRALPVEVRALPPRPKRQRKPKASRLELSGTFKLSETGRMTGTVDGRRALLELRPGHDGAEEWTFRWRI